MFLSSSLTAKMLLVGQRSLHTSRLISPSLFIVIWNFRSIFLKTKSINQLLLFDCQQLALLSDFTNIFPAITIFLKSSGIVVGRQLSKFLCVWKWLYWALVIEWPFILVHAASAFSFTWGYHPAVLWYLLLVRCLPLSMVVSTISTPGSDSYITPSFEHGWAPCL